MDIDSEEKYNKLFNDSLIKDAVLEKNLSFEPQEALFGGDGGEEIIFELLKDYLNKEISFFSCEIGYDQKDKIMKEL